MHFFRNGTFGLLVVISWATTCAQTNLGEKSVQTHSAEHLLDTVRSRTVIQASPESSLFANEKGIDRPIVLEFWATWCGPCLIEIPHLNELATHPALSEIDFVAISADGDAAPVKDLLNRIPIQGTVLLDSERTTWEALEISAIPVSVLINRKGEVVGKIHPGNLTRQHLLDLVRNGTPNLGKDRRIGVSPGYDPFAPKQFRKLDTPVRLVIRESVMPQGTSMQAHDDCRATFLGVTAIELLSHAHEIPISRIDLRSSLFSANYDLVAAVPNGYQDSYRSMVTAAVHACLGVDVEFMEREVATLVIRRTSSTDIRLRHTTSKSASGGSKQGMIKVFCQPVEALANILESQLLRPVTNETGINGNFDFDLEWTPGNHDELVRQLEEQHGLKLTIELRMLSILVVNRSNATLRD